MDAEDLSVRYTVLLKASKLYAEGLSVFSFKAAGSGQFLKAQPQKTGAVVVQKSTIFKTYCTLFSVCFPLFVKLIRRFFKPCSKTSN
jgi:hypothetical protein